MNSYANSYNASKISADIREKISIPPISIPRKNQVKNTRNISFRPTDNTISDRKGSLGTNGCLNLTMDSLDIVANYNKL